MCQLRPGVGIFSLGEDAVHSSSGDGEECCERWGRAGDLNKRSECFQPA